MLWCKLCLYWLVLNYSRKNRLTSADQSISELPNYNYIHSKLRYEKPDDCVISVVDHNIGLICNLRTMNSEYDTTNFTVIPADNTASLTILCDSQLIIKSKLYPKSFSHLKYLKQLSIEYCKIDKLNESIFVGLDYLKNLTIRTFNVNWPSFNLEIDSKTFINTSHLEMLDLSVNNIWTLPEHTFCPLTNLRFLNLSGNRLQDVNDFGFREKKLNQSSSSSSNSNCTFDLEILDASFNHFVLLPPFAFGALKRLKILKVNNNEISMVADKAFEGLKILKSIDMNSNKIVALPSELFRDQSNSLEEILLHDNKITVLSPNLFSNLSQLQVLDVSKNQLTSSWVNRNTLKGLIRLVLLDLSFNQINKLDLNIFTDLFSLQVLNLCHNQIEVLSTDTFALLNNLHKLYLSHNKIKYLDAYSLNHLYTLSELAIDNNLITDLHPDTFRNCSALEKLHLNMNKLTKVPVAIKNMHYLQEVDLGENLISDLNEPGFDGLFSLKGLRLISNQISKLNKDSLKDLSNLQILNLANNHIDKIEDDTFADKLHLQAIRLDENKLENVDNLFKNLPSLTWLNMSGNFLDHLKYDTLPITLEWVDLHKNKIKTIDSTGLEKIINLRTLDLSFNELVQITPTSFPNNIELLFLNDNLITEIEPHSFINKKHLMRVDLYANRLISINEKAFRLERADGKLELPEFYIGGNPFVCDCNIEWLKNINAGNTQTYPRIMDIEKIYCKLLHNRKHSYMQLINATPIDFLCKYNVHCFTLCQCCEFDACDCEMTCPQNCTCFHDQSWVTNLVDCTLAGYEKVPSNFPMDSTQIFLDGNNIKELPSHIFIGRKNLKVLFANHSNLQTIHNSSFFGLRKLEVLHLEFNHIDKLLGSEFTQLNALKELYLQHNQLFFIAENTFANMTDLSILRLDNNRLTNFEVWNLALNTHLSDISLAFNSWTCDCGFVNKLKTFISNNANKVQDYKHISCTFNGAVTFLLEKNTTKCIFREGITSIIKTEQIESILPFLLTFTIIFIIIFGFVVGLLCYRKELKIWIQSSCVSWCICFESHDDDNSLDKEQFYDAFIIYSLKDDPFVNQTLSRALEETCGYRLFLYHRDVDLNRYFLEIIREILERSNRVLLVLSTNFIYNEWSKFEFKGILNEVVQRRKKLVIILLGELPHTDLDSDLRYLLRTNACIEWDDRMFWQKLKIALPTFQKVGNSRQLKKSDFYKAAEHYETKQQREVLVSRNGPHRLSCQSYATVNSYSLNKINQNNPQFLNSKDLITEKSTSAAGKTQEDTPLNEFPDQSLLPNNNLRNNDNFEWISSTSQTSTESNFSLKSKKDAYANKYSENPENIVNRNIDLKNVGLHSKNYFLDQDCINRNSIPKGNDHILVNSNNSFYNSVSDPNCNETSLTNNATSKTVYEFK